MAQTPEVDHRFTWLFCDVKRIKRDGKQTYKIYYEYPTGSKGIMDHTVSPDKLQKQNCYATVSKPGWYAVEMDTRQWAPGVNHHTWKRCLDFPNRAMWLNCYRSYMQQVQGFNAANKPIVKADVDDAMYEACVTSGFETYKLGYTVATIEQASKAQSYYVLVGLALNDYVITGLEEVPFPSAHAAREAGQKWLEKYRAEALNDKDTSPEMKSLTAILNDHQVFVLTSPHGRDDSPLMW